MLRLFLLPALLAAVQAPAPPANTRCPVCGGKVGANSRKVVVRKRTYYICECSGCGPELVRNPDKYLNSDGSLKPR